MRSLEKPMMFSTWSVRQILAGKKTQTRRIVGKLRWSISFSQLEKSKTPRYDWSFRDQNGRWNEYKDSNFVNLAPYLVGEHVWIRETWSPDHAAFYPHWPVVRRADGEIETENGQVFSPEVNAYFPFQWRSPMYMPKSAARPERIIIASVKCQRLQDITAHDALEEGIAHSDYWQPSELQDRPFEEKWHDDYHFWRHYPQLAYSKLWDSINEKTCPWASNPWVWVYGLEVVKS